MTKIIATGPHCWGTGPDIAEAVRNCWINMPTSVRDPRRGPKIGVPVIQPRLCPDDARVTDYGSIVYDRDEGAPVMLGYLDRTRKPVRAPEEEN